LPWDPGGSELVVCIVQWQCSVLVNLHHPSSLGTGAAKMEVYVERLRGKPLFKEWGMSESASDGPRQATAGSIYLREGSIRGHRTNIKNLLLVIYCSSSSSSISLFCTQNPILLLLIFFPRCTTSSLPPRSCACCLPKLPSQIVLDQLSVIDWGCAIGLLTSHSLGNPSRKHAGRRRASQASAVGTGCTGTARS
jgi:hypothetical protein